MAKLPNIIERERPLWRVIWFVLRESVRGSKKYSLIRYIAAGLGAALSFVEFGALALIVNEFATHTLPEVRTWVLIQGFIFLALSDLLPSLAWSLHNYAWNVQMEDMERHLQRLQFTAMDRLDIGTVEQSEFQNILEVANNRGWGSFFSIINIITNALRNVVSLGIATVSLIIISPFALLAIFLGALPTYIFEQKNAKLAAGIWKESAEMRRMWRAKVSPVFGKNSLVELKNFNLVGIFLKKFLSIIGKFHAVMKAFEKKKFLNNVSARIILTIGFGIAFALLIHQVYIGAIAVGALVFSFSVVSRFQYALNTLFSDFGRMTEHKKNIDTMLDLFEMRPLITSGSRKISPSEKIKIEFKKVSFSYPGNDKLVLKKISLTIEAGENLAIVGLNGAGKTTFLRLLTRVYDPTSGEILVNGIPLSEYDVKDWRRCLGILLQDYTLYSEETIAENIMLGDISKHENTLVEQSAQETTAHEFITELPEKYQQKIGTEFRGGVELSKGQRQKVALARVLYRNAPIIVLDEPTAAVDALSEDTIFKSLHDNHADQTRIVISHKFSNVRGADQIILIKDGTIIERGTHDELMKFKGEYATLFELQAEGYR